MFQQEFEICLLYVSTFQVKRCRKRGKSVKDVLVKCDSQPALLYLFTSISNWSDSATKDYNFQINYCGQIFSCDIYDYY